MILFLLVIGVLLLFLYVLIKGLDNYQPLNVDFFLFIFILQIFSQLNLKENVCFA